MPTLVRLDGWRGLKALVGLVADPLSVTGRIVSTWGEAVQLRPPLMFGPANYFLHLAGPRLAEAVFRHPEIYTNGGIIVRGYAGSRHNDLRQGYFSANGREYDHYKDLLGPFFRRGVVNEAAPVILDIVARALDGWRTGEPVNVTRHFNDLVKRLALAAICRDRELAPGLAAADAVESHARLAGASVGATLAAVLGRAPLSRLHRQADATFRALVAWGETRRGCPVHADPVAALVNAPTERGEPASPARIAGYGWTLLGAAYDTSTSILTWLLVLLATHPDVAARLHAELATCGVDAERDLAGLMELPFLDAVIREALRLVPPAPIQRRKVRAAGEIAGIPVENGASILVSAWATNRDPALYPEPDRFRPERWETMTRTPYEWLTFSAGPRRCLGMWYALAFLKATLAQAHLRYRADIADGVRIDMKLKVTVRPSPDLVVTLHRQDRAFRRARVEGGVRRHIRFEP